MAKGGYYAVANGRKVGVYGSWDECRAQVDGFSQARYKKFVSKSEALAFIANYQLGRKSFSNLTSPTNITRLFDSSDSLYMASFFVFPLL
ncbi:hypothetical protein COOONC_19258 [Cooperia oncophora]